MKKHILSLLISLFACYQGYGQWSAVEFKLRPEMANKSNLTTEALEIRALSVKHDVEMRQSYPNAKTPELLLLYTLRIKDNGMNTEGKESTVNRERRENIIGDFLATGKFENDVFEFGTAYTNSCTNPISVNDPHFHNVNRWPLDMIQASCAWTITKGNPNILIGIADTEFETTHDDLKNKIAGIYGPVSGGNHHGTIVASVAAAETNNGVGMASVGYNSMLALHRISPAGADVHVRANVA